MFQNKLNHVKILLLIDSMNEVENAKKSRDWALHERQKIVQERDSIRTLCDSLRHERDRAVSDKAKTLRDCDELKKQKTEACKELKETRSDTTLNPFNTEWILLSILLGHLLLYWFI